MPFTRLQQQSSAVSSNLGGGTAPMDIGATYQGKGKGKGKGKNNSTGKGKQQWQPRQQAKGDKGKGKNKGQQKGKGKNPMSGCYICGQPGHMAKDCMTTVYKMSETPQEQTQDGTGQWYDQQNGYDPYWYSNDITSYANNQNYTQQQQALPPPPHSNRNRMHKRAAYRPYTLSQQWHHQIRAWQQHSSMKPTITQKQKSWLTVERQHMSAHHGLHKTHPFTHSNKDRGRV